LLAVYVDEACALVFTISQVVKEWPKMLCDIDSDMLTKNLTHEAGFWLGKLIKEAPKQLCKPMCY
jgi:hypothetical protein